MSSAHEDILRELETVVGEELQVVSFKWLSRRYGLQVNLAKQLLFAFVERHKAKVKATYLLAGWTKAEPSQHVVRLVDQESLLKSRELLTPVTSLHVYSIQPTQPKDPAELWNVDNGQLSQLFDDMVKLSLDNCLVDNRWGGVACPEAKRDPSLAARPPMPARPAATAAAPAKNAKASKASGGIVAAIDAVAAGATNSKQGIATTSIAAGPGNKPQPASTADDPDPDLPAPAKTAVPPVERKPSGGSASGSLKPNSQPARGSGKGKSQLANMWSKAPPKPAKAQPAADAKSASHPSGAPADAEEALRQAQEAGSGSDSDDELPPVRQAFLRNHPQNGKPSQQLADSESDEDDLKKPSKPAAASKAGKAAGSKTKPSAKVAPAKASGASKAGAKKSSGAAAPAKRAASASGISQSQQQQQSESTAGGSVAGGASKRRRVVLEDESSDEDEEVATATKKGDDAMDVDPAASQPAAKGKPKGAGKAKAARGSKGSKAGKPGKQSQAAEAPEDDIEVDIDGTDEDGSQQEDEKGKRKRVASKKAAPKPGTAKAGPEQGADGRKRRKVPRSTYNDKGEEVTEMVWEEDSDDLPLASAASGDTSAALKERSGNEEQGKTAAQPALQGAPAAKPAKDSGGSSGAVKKSGKSSKAAAGNQRGIMTFFGKK